MWPYLIEAGTKARSLQFVDLNKHEQSFALTYTPQIKLCDETLSRLRQLDEECAKARITLKKPRDLDDFRRGLQALCRIQGKSEHVIFEHICKDVHDKIGFV